MRRLAAIWVVAVACSVENEPRSFRVPSNEDFARVSGMLEAHCGSLDCHGQPGRNFLVHGKNGLRLSPDDVPGARPTTTAEHDANYASSVSLEPELMGAVVRDGGSNPERLTLVRKPRNHEQHEGGDVLDTSADRCLVSWLEGAVDAQACFDGSILAKPPGFSGSGATGGSGGSSGSGGSGGSGTGGLGGTGGTGGSSATGGTGGVTCGKTEFWPCTYDEACVPAAESPVGHEAYANVECLSCHVAGGAAGPGLEFLFGGVVYDPYDGTGAPSVEIAVRDGAAFHYACTDSLGFFFVPAAGNPEPAWKTVETRMRAELGQKTMPPDKEHKPTCNEAECHGHVEHPLLAPF